MSALASRRLYSLDRLSRFIAVVEPLERRALLNAVPAGPEFSLSPPQDGSQAFQQIAHDAAGNFVAVWTSQSNQRLLGVWARRFDASGAPRGDAFQVGPQAYGQAALAMDPSGDFVVAWADAFGTTGRVHARRYSSGGVAQGEEILQQLSTGNPSLAMSADGDFVLTFGTADRDRLKQMQYQCFNADGTPKGPAAGVDENPSNFFFLGPPAVAADAEGNFVVAWADGPTWYRRFDDAGRPLGPKARVMPSDGLAGAPDEVLMDLAMNAAGDFVVAVEGVPGPSARAFDRFGSPRSERLLLTEGGTRSLDADWPDVDMAADGGFVAAWAEGFPTMGIFARAFDAAGVPFGDVFTVTTGGNGAPSVTLGAAGDMLFAWSQPVSNPEGPPDADIYAQRFTRVPKPAALDRVFVKGTGWTSRFTDYLGAHGLGASAWGFAAGGTPDPRALPWSALDQVTFRFTRDVEVTRDDLTVRGATVPVYRFRDFNYDPTARAATWTLERPFGADRLMLTLDGSVLSGPGEDAADYVFPLNVLPGDAYRDRSVNAIDLAYVRLRQLTSTDRFHSSSGGITYQSRADVTGDGRINALDLAAVKRGLGRSLPGEPVAPAAGSGPSITRELLR